MRGTVNTDDEENNNVTPNFWGYQTYDHRDKSDEKLFNNITEDII